MAKSPTAQPDAPSLPASAAVSTTRNGVLMLAEQLFAEAFRIGGQYEPKHLANECFKAAEVFHQVWRERQS